MHAYSRERKPFSLRSLLTAAPTMSALRMSTLSLPKAALSVSSISLVWFLPASLVFATLMMYSAVAGFGFETLYQFDCDNYQGQVDAKIEAAKEAQ